MNHPFAQYIQILGKGQRGARDLTQEEARTAMQMILAGQVEPEQLGAFLMLLRIKEENAAELAGFVQAARAALPQASSPSAVALDWSSYAGKRRQLPWYLLSALLLAQHDLPVLMHGVASGSADRVYAPQALAALGVPLANSPDEAADQLRQHRFAFLPLDKLSPPLDRLLQLKTLLGLRSPIHTVARMLNPLTAPAAMIGIFHPGYDLVHRQAAQLLGDTQLAVFKGEGGEAERNPDAECTLRLLQQHQPQDEVWPPLFGQRHLKDEAMDLARLARVWSGDDPDEYALASITGTTAIALRALGHAADAASARKLAAELWLARQPNPYPR